MTIQKYGALLTTSYGKKLLESKKIRVALVGCGTIAKKHIHVLKSMDKCHVIAVCDVGENVAKRFADTYDIVNHYTDCKQMLREQSVDIVCILTPSYLHYENIIQALPYVKNIVVEKPLALSNEHADDILKKCKENAASMFVVMQNRYNRPIRALKQAIEQNRFGKLVLGTVNVLWRRERSYYRSSDWRGVSNAGGGVLANQANHHIDMLQWMMGPVKSVMAVTATRVAPIEAEDTAIASVQFVSGALGVVEATTAVSPRDIGGSISILGEKGSVIIGGASMDKLEKWEFDETLPADKNIFTDFGKNPCEYAWNHKEYLEGVLDTICNHKPPCVDAEEARKTVLFTNAMYESARKNSLVNLFR